MKPPRLLFLAALALSASVPGSAPAAPAPTPVPARSSAPLVAPAPLNTPAPLPVRVAAGSVVPTVAPAPLNTPAPLSTPAFTPQGAEGGPDAALPVPTGPATAPAPMAAPTPPVINGDALPGLPAPAVPGGGIFDEVERRAIDARRASELSENVDPNQPRSYLNTDNLPLSTLLLVLAKQARVPYMAPQFKTDPATTFYSPEPILPYNAFRYVAEHNGFTISQDAAGIYTLKPSSTSYRYAIYVLRSIPPPYALQDLAQGLGFTIAKPAANIETIPAPAGGSGGGGGGGGGGSSSGLVSGSGSSSDEQVQPRYTPGLPMDTPVSQRKDATDTGLIYVDRANNAIVLYDTEAHHETARRIISRVDRAETQIRLETQVVQISRTNDTNIGFDWTQSLGKGLTFNFAPGTSSAGVNNFFFYPEAGLFSYPNIQTTLHALETHGLLRTINHTFITMKQGIPTPISDTTEESVVLQSGYTGSTNVNTGSGSSTTAGGGLSSTSQIEKYHYGVSFDAFVWLQQGDKVRINLNPQVSTKIGETQSSQGPIPIISRQKTTQDVTVPSGKTFCFAGTIRSNQGRTDTDVPLLARTPILGPLFFRNRVKTDEVATLVYFVTPTIIRPSENPDIRLPIEDAEYLGEFNRNRPDFVPGGSAYAAGAAGDKNPVPLTRAQSRERFVPTAKAVPAPR